MDSSCEHFSLTVFKTQGRHSSFKVKALKELILVHLVNSCFYYHPRTRLSCEEIWLMKYSSINNSEIHSFSGAYTSAEMGSKRCSSELIYRSTNRHRITSASNLILQAWNTLVLHPGLEWGRVFQQWSFVTHLAPGAFCCLLVLPREVFVYTLEKFAWQCVPLPQWHLKMLLQLLSHGMCSAKLTSAGVLERQRNRSCTLPLLLLCRKQPGHAAIGKFGSGRSQLLNTPLQSQCFMEGGRRKKEGSNVWFFQWPVFPLKGKIFNHSVFWFCLKTKFC